MSRLLTSLELVYNNVYSQNGEDGIIEFIMWKLGVQKGTFVEFGAWDGLMYSNTCNLWRHNSWSGLLIEPDPARFQKLLENTKTYPGVKCSQNFVGPENINQIFEENGVPTDLDLLSIDIDGNDYYTWQALDPKYQAKVVIIEPTWGRNRTHNPADGDGPDGQRISSNGSNALPLIALGKAKGYELLEHNGNIILLRRDLFDKLGFRNPEDLRVRFRRYQWAPGTEHHNYDWYNH